MDEILTRIVGRWSESGLIEKSDEDVYAYGLDLLIFSILNILVILVTSLVINKIIESIILLAVIIPLQSYGGGYHAKTHLRCFIAMYIGWWCVIIIIPLISPLIALFISIASMPVYFALAPVPHENVKMSPAHRLKLRKIIRFMAFGIGLLSIILTLITPVDNLNLGVLLSTGLGVTAISMLAAHFSYKVRQSKQRK